MRVFVSAPLPGDAVDLLRRHAEVVVGEGLGVRGATFLEGAPHFDAALTLLTDRVDGELLRRCPKLRLVANMAVGVDNVDLSACREAGVTVTNTPDVLTEATADLAFGLLLATARRIAEGDRGIRAGDFPPWTPTTMLGTRVFGGTLGLVGFGRIGQAMARRARGFGIHALYTQRTRLPENLERATGARYLPLDALVAEADFVSLHCPLTDETRKLISAERLARMKPGAIVVNTARGGCVDEAALIAALESGHLGGAGLDVFEDEPRVPARLAALPNVVLTPHVASADRSTREAMARLAAENVVAFVQGLPLRTPVGAYRFARMSAKAVS